MVRETVRGTLRGTVRETVRDGAGGCLSKAAHDSKLGDGGAAAVGGGGGGVLALAVLQPHRAELHAPAAANWRESERIGENGRGLERFG